MTDKIANEATVDGIKYVQLDGRGGHLWWREASKPKNAGNALDTSKIKSLEASLKRSEEDWNVHRHRLQTRAEDAEKAGDAASAGNFRRELAEGDKLIEQEHAERAEELGVLAALAGYEANYGNTKWFNR